MKIHVITDDKGEVIATVRHETHEAATGDDIIPVGKPEALPGQTVHELELPEHLHQVKDPEELHQHLRDHLDKSRS
jgi:hypothetical protein